MLDVNSLDLTPGRAEKAVVRFLLICRQTGLQSVSARRIRLRFFVSEPANRSWRGCGESIWDGYRFGDCWWPLSWLIQGRLQAAVEQWALLTCNYGIGKYSTPIARLVSEKGVMASRHLIELSFSRPPSLSIIYKSCSLFATGQRVIAPLQLTPWLRTCARTRWIVKHENPNPFIIPWWRDGWAENE